MDPWQIYPSRYDINLCVSSWVSRNMYLYTYQHITLWWRAERPNPRGIIYPTACGKPATVPRPSDLWIDWSMDRSIDWWMDGLMYRSSHWLIDWLIHGLMDWFFESLDQWSDRSIHKFRWKSGAIDRWKESKFRWKNVENHPQIDQHRQKIVKKGTSGPPRGAQGTRERKLMENGRKRG